MCGRHRWVIQRTFALSISVVPSWAEARQRLEDFDEGGEAGLLKSIGVLDPVLDRIEDALRANDLWDTRRV